MSARVIEILGEVEAAAKAFAAKYAPPRVPLGTYRPHFQLPQKLSVELATVPEFAVLQGCQFSTWNLTAGLDVSFLAGALIERVIDGTPAADAFNDLMDLIQKRTADIYVLKGIGGIAVEGAVTLGEGVTVMPAEKAPPTKAREDMFDLDRNGVRIFRGSIVKEAAPNVALMIKGRMTVIHGPDADWSERKSLTEQIVRKQECALTSLTLSGPECAPFAVSVSSWIDHPAYPYSGFGHQGYGTSQGVSPVKRGKVDPALACALYERLTHVKGSHCASLIRAAERLQRSRSHTSEVDRAIDLGIAIEMVFLHEQQADRGELKYRTSVRGAWLLGKSGAERRTIFNSLRKAYDARSVAVHSGELADQRLIENLPAADGFCADAIRLVINEGGFPDKWESLVLDEGDEQQLRTATAAND